MLRSILSIGALLWSAPLFSQSTTAADPRLVQGKFAWFELTETKVRVERALGAPMFKEESGADFEGWFYRVGVAEPEESSLHLVFRRSTGVLAIVTRNFAPERNVDSLFPEASTASYCQPVSPAPYCMRVRRLPGNRLLIAMGISNSGQATGQLVLIRESELRFVQPWLAERLERERQAQSSK